MYFKTETRKSYIINKEATSDKKWKIQMYT